MLKTYTMGLCMNRHPAEPFKNGIFGSYIARPNDFENLEKIADKRIPLDCDKLSLYISGMTCAVLAVVNVCRRRNIMLTAYHYDPSTGTYNAQEIH